MKDTPLTFTPQQIIALANHYNTPAFIDSDPVQFPHRSSEKKDIEISAFLTSWISWGNRKQIIRTAQTLHTDIMGDKPLEYLNSRCWTKFKNNPHCFYRTVKYGDLYQLLQRLYDIYQKHNDLEECVLNHLDKSGGDPSVALSDIFTGIAGIADARKKSPCKRLWFFLRWMVRQDHIVDLGIWQKISPSLLIIPLDTHVHKVALHLGITTRRATDIATAREITQYFKKLLPDDPALGDFALFTYGIENHI